MTYLDAAFTILQAAGEALHYEEITRRALDQNLIASQGLTPAATMGSRLYTVCERKKRAPEALAHNAQVTVTLEIEAEVPAGVPDHVVRVVTENGLTLKFESHGFEAE